jgi:ABC-type lipoprotein export system ATPase subunit
VLEVFEELARQGKTIVLVTHDQDIARRGNRVIELYDGQIISSLEPDNG